MKLFIVVLLVFLIYLPSLKGDFLNWDDREQIVNNYVIQNISVENLKKIFTQSTVAHYHPLVNLSLAGDYALYGLKPFGYHVTNLILHLFNVVWVYLFIFLLSGRINLALFVALLFGIHPMHVESVAWLSERKDVLYVFFYLPALICYWRYLEGGGRKFFNGTLILFLLSLFSKATAVTLPFVLILLDFMKGRISRKSLIEEKFVFYLLSVFFGLITLYFSWQEKALLAQQVYTLSERIVLSGFGFILYFFKLLVPVEIVPLYPSPSPGLGWTFYLVSLLGFLILGISMILFKRNKDLFGGILFFFAVVSVNLPLFMVGSSYLADRYTYLSSIGIFYSCGWILFEVYGRLSYKNLLKILFVGYIFILSFLSFKYVPIWNNSLDLWSYVIHRFPQMAIPYNNRGLIYYEQGHWAKALDDFNQVIILDPDLAGIYSRRGLIYKVTGDLDKALADFDKAVEMEPDNVVAYNNRANVYIQLGRFDDAVSDFHSAIKLKDDFFEAHFNLGNLLFMFQEYPLAIEYYSNAIRINPQSGISYRQRAKAYFFNHELEKAKEDLNRALQYIPDDAEALKLISKFSQ